MSTLAAPARFDIGRAITLSFSAYGRNFARLIALSLLLYVLPSLLLSVLQVRHSMEMLSRGPLAISEYVTAWPLSLASAAVALVSAALLRIAVVRTVLGDLSGRPVGFTECLSSAVRDVLPVMGLIVVFVLGIAFGLFLLVVPGVILFLAWCVALPAQVVEGPGIMRAFSRSADLTRNRRGAIFVVWLVVGVANWIAQTTLTAVIVGLFGSASIGAALLSGGQGLAGFYWATLGAGFVQGTLLGSVDAVVASALYFELRAGKEGVGFDQVADVFS